MSHGTALAPDAAMVLGIASTAMPFARSPQDQAERWLRLLRLHGEVGIALQSLGVSEVPLPEVDASAHPGHVRGEAPSGDPVGEVTVQSARTARARGASGVETRDVLMAVMRVYGEDFDRVLEAHGTDRDEVLSRLDVQLSDLAGS